MSEFEHPNVHGDHFIAGQRRATDRGTVTSVNPMTRTRGSIQFPEGTADEINEAVAAAVAAFEDTRTYPATQLADFLDTVADEIEALGDAYLEITSAETGLGIPRLTGERGRTTSQLRKFGALLREGSYVEAIIDTPDPDRQPSPKPDLRRMLVPLGPVAVFSASNFPYAFSVAGGDTASAFAAGCPVIVKAHPGHPATSELAALAITRAVEKSGFPAGVFSLIHGSGNDVGQALVKHPGIQAVGFTGSLRGGRALYDAAAQRPVPIPVYAEMGSVNPMVITQQAIASRLEAIADGLTTSLTLGSGQFCTNPGLVFVPAANSQTFIDAVAERMSNKDPGVLLNESIVSGLEKAVEATTAQAEVATVAGASVVEGQGFCYANTVLQTTAQVFCEEETMQTEHFGPVVLFVTYTSQEDLLAALRVLHGNLTATIHAEDDELDRARAIYSVLREKVGRLIWNGYPTGVEVAYAMQHGGPYPATTAPRTTSVGMTAIKRFMRPVTYQNVPDALVPPALQRANPLGIMRIVDNAYSRESLSP